MIRLLSLLALLLFGAGTAAAPAQAAADALPSWRDGPEKRAILNFVKAAVTGRSPGYIPPAERIAVFDNDGTLWAEKPVYFQIFFAIDRAREMARSDPDFASTPALKAAIKGDFERLAAMGKDGLLELVAATHSGLTVEAFQAQVRDWLEHARHPQTGLLFRVMVYRPMLELLDHLRDNGFKTYIVSGGGVDFMRAFAPEIYGVPRENVIGSLGKARLVLKDGGPRIMKDPGILFIDDKEGKPLAIMRHIGRRPVFAAGNSDGDLAMLQWSLAGGGQRLGLLIHHTDADREWAYDRESQVGRLDEALNLAPEGGWIVVDMAEDWERVYPEN